MPPGDGSLAVASAASSTRQQCGHLLDRLAQLGDRVESVIGLFLQAALDDGVDRPGDLGIAGGDRRDDRSGRAEGMLIVERFHRPAREREPAGEHLEEDDAEGIDVGADIDRLRVAELLGGHVRAGPQLRAGARQAGIGRLPRLV